MCMCVQREEVRKLSRGVSQSWGCVYYGRELEQTETAGEIIDHIIYSLANADPASC